MPQVGGGHPVWSCGDDLGYDAEDADEKGKSPTLVDSQILDDNLLTGGNDNVLACQKPEWIGSRVAGELSLRSTHSISIVHLNESPGQDAVLLSTDRLGTHGWEGVKQLEFQFQDVS